MSDIKQRLSTKTPEVKENLKKVNIVSFGLPSHLHSFINSLTDLQRRILREFFYFATRSIVACTEDGFIGFETTYSWIAYRVGCHYKTVQSLIEKLRGYGLVYRFIQFLKKRWVRNLIYRLLTPVVFVSSCLLSGTINTIDREDYPHINYNMYKYKKEIEEVARSLRKKRENTMNQKSPHNEIGNFSKPYQQTRADVLDRKNLKRPEYNKYVPKPEREKEDLNILEKFFNYYTNADSAFKRFNPYRKEFDKAVDDMVKDKKVDLKEFKISLYKIYLAKHGRRNEDVHPTRQTNTPPESKSN